MKWIAKCMIVAATVCVGSGAYAQTAEANIENHSMLAEAKIPAAEVQAKEVTITLKNDCTRHISVFAGSKKEVFDGKSQPIGGMSNNTLYIKENDVVCIMTDPKTIQACAIAKPGVTKVEINSSGNGFVK
jgi:hypothetical protein